MGFQTNCICKAAMGLLVKFNNINCNWEAVMELLFTNNCIWEVAIVFLANMDLTNCILEDPIVLLVYRCILWSTNWPGTSRGPPIYC